MLLRKPLKNTKRKPKNNMKPQLPNIIGAILFGIAITTAQAQSSNVTSENGVPGVNPESIDPHLTTTTIEEQARTIQAIADEAGKDFDLEAYYKDISSRLESRLAEIEPASEPAAHTAAPLEKTDTPSKRTLEPSQPVQGLPAPPAETHSPGSLLQSIDELETSVRNLSKEVEALRVRASHLGRQ